MILKTSRIKTASGPHALTRHLFHGKGNEEIVCIQGSKAALAMMVDDARAAGRTYGIRHLVINPEEVTSRAEALEVLRFHGNEFGYDPTDCTLIEHRKPRQDGQGFGVHWHAAIPEMKLDGAVLDSRFMFRRNEMVARLAEARLGHRLTPGRHNAWAAAALEQRGFHDAALAVRLGPAAPSFGPAAQAAPRESYSSATHQILKRNGLSTPAIKAAISAAWATREEIGLPFKKMLHHTGIDLVPGKRPGAWVAAVNGVEITALHRLLKVKSSEVESEMATQRKAPAWTRAAGGYGELSTQNQKRAQGSFQAFQRIYHARHGTEYPYDLENYVSWAQEQEAQRQQSLSEPSASRRPRAFNDTDPSAPQETPSPAAQVVPSRPKSLPLPDDKDALKRVIGESPWSDANRDPARISDEYRRRVQVVREKAEKRLGTTEKTIERTAPKDEIAEGKGIEKLADIAAGIALKLINTVLKVLGIPEIPHPNFGGPRVVGQLPGNPKEHEQAHQEAEKLREYIANLPDDEAVTLKSQQVAQARQVEHDDWLDNTAPARLKLSGIEAKEEAEREEQERRARVEEARQAQAVAARERVEIDAPELGPEVRLDEEIERLKF
ncbi:hypothetical protein FOH24_17050 [Acetobacter tropicalis]|uniref:Uncharacterized protein n=1 Tax=Acetobacter tropicalis TaxID=104102 RepID=A0A094ZFX0_9PROT|nr:hypothetical protein [Acetobacter tropicalis]KAA8383924.1 hypothetical protein FOH24_17050 [Acetobacter tropicalis]KAA8391318.1 hypothetical protein FOH22_00235 [Acetobacter tropicalis]KGB21501.1 hypothetical protein AtDm6_2735 [Acetobacter tropicalis]MBC9007848.1 hypothetical protein [Acetobacter tropicalis]MDO8172453.1 hypothetical protein [Acetobacter tropicalis]